MMWSYGSGYGLGVGLLWIILLPLAGFLFGLGFFAAKGLLLQQKKR